MSMDADRPKKPGERVMCRAVVFLKLLNYLNNPP